MPPSKGEAPPDEVRDGFVLGLLFGCTLHEIAEHAQLGRKAEQRRGEHGAHTRGHRQRHARGHELELPLVHQVHFARFFPRGNQLTVDAQLLAQLHGLGLGPQEGVRAPVDEKALPTFRDDVAAHAVPRLNDNNIQIRLRLFQGVGGG